MTTTETELKISEEPLAERVLRQVRSGELDESRLLPSAEKRARDVGKKLDRLAARQGWYTFMAGQAYAVATGKAPSKRNAEVMAVEQVMRWRSEVSRFCARPAGGVRRADRGRAEQSGARAEGRTVRAGAGGELVDVGGQVLPLRRFSRCEDVRLAGHRS